MSAGYGYIRIQFTKEDGTADSRIAKEAYEYCTKSFDFFNTVDGRFQDEAEADEWEDDWSEYGDAFDLDEKNGDIFTCGAGDGLDIKRTCPEAVDGDWVQDVYNQFKPYQMKVQFYQDYSESSFDSNTITRYQVIERFNERVLFKCRNCNFTNGARFDCDWGHFEQDDEDYYLLDEDFNQFNVMAKNKKTGRIVDLGEASMECDEDDEDVILHRGLYDSDGNQVALGDEDSAVSWDWWQDKIDDEDITLEEGESADQSEWTFYISVPGENIFFKKPKEAPASECAGGSSAPAQKISCPNCGTENDAGTSFCENCGTKLEGTAAAEPAGRPSIEDRLNRMQADMDAKLDSFFGNK